jgi:putative ribosome biogenesis GTPase RsgA
MTKHGIGKHNTFELNNQISESQTKGQHTTTHLHNGQS